MRRVMSGIIVLLCAVAPAAAAETTRIIVPFSAGSTGDVIARSVGEALSQELNEAVVIENKPGAGGALAALAVIQAPSDGRTLLAIPTGMLEPMETDPYKLPDFALISLISTNPVVLVVGANSSYKTFSDLIRGKPKNYAVNNARGSVGKIASEQLLELTNTCAIAIPYSGDVKALVDVMRGEVAFMFAHGPGIVGHLQAGSLRALAVADPQRSEFLPGVPTVAEAGLSGFRVRPAGLGLAAPKGTPVERVNRLVGLIRKISQKPEMRGALQRQWIKPLHSTPEEFEAFARAYPTPSFHDPCSVAR
jgi:tripartite-type tricarboxylate transporter receptor subunit TctC